MESLVYIKEQVHDVDVCIQNGMVQKTEYGILFTKHLQM